jgi:hypothetical protein
MDYASKLGFDLKLIYYIRVLEEIVLYDDGITILSDLWHGSYDLNSWIVKQKKEIYESIANNFTKNCHENIDEIIEGVKLLFDYLDSKMVINKLTNPRKENDVKDFYHYNPEYLKNPDYALQDLNFQLACLAC